MTVYRVKAPNGKTYDLDMPEGATEQDAINYANRAYPGKQQAGFFQSFKEGFQTAGDAPEALSFAGASPEQEAEKRKAFLAAQESPYARTAAADVKDVSSGLDWLLQNAGQSFGYMAGPGLAGAAATAMKSPGAGRVVGGGLLGLQYLTENLGRQAGEQQQAIDQGEQADPTSIGRAVIAAAGATALDVFQAKMFAPLYNKFPAMAKMLGEEGEEATKETTEQLISAFRNNTLKASNGIATAIGRGVVFEVPQEIAQQALERWQAGLSLTDDSAKQEYIEAAAGAIALGSGMGAASKYFENASKMAQAEALDRADRNAMGEEQKEARKFSRKEAAIERQGMTDEDKLANIDSFLRNVPPMSKEDLKKYLKDNMPGLVVNSRDAGINVDKLKREGVFVVDAAGMWSVNPAAPPPRVPTKVYQKPTAVDPNAPAVDPNAPAVDPNATPPVVDPNATPPVVDPNATPPAPTPDSVDNILTLVDALVDRGMTTEDAMNFVDSFDTANPEVLKELQGLINSSSNDSSNPAENDLVTTQEATPPANDSTADRLSSLLNEAVKRHRMEAQGQSILDDMEENQISPRDVGRQFWTNVYPNLNSQTQVRYERYLKDLGYEPGGVLSSDRDGNVDKAFGWQDAGLRGFADNTVDDVNYLEGTERGFVSLMKWANDQYEKIGAANAQESEQAARIGRDESGGAGASPASSVQQTPTTEEGQTQTSEPSGVDAAVESDARPDVGTQELPPPLADNKTETKPSESRGTMRYLDSDNNGNVSETASVEWGPAEIDPNRVLVHENENVVDPKANTTQPILDVLSNEFGTQNVNSFTHMVGDTFRQLRDLVSEVMGYPEMRQHAIGVSIGPYRGVATSTDIRGYFVNPFLRSDFQDISRRANSIFGTMLHELTHYKDRGHGPSFEAEMRAIDNALQNIVHTFASDPAKAQAYNNLRQQFVDRMAANPVYQQMISRYTELSQKTRDKANAGTNTPRLQTRGRPFNPNAAYEQSTEGGSNGSTGGVPSQGGGTTAGQGVPTGSPTGAQPAQNGGKPRRSAKKTARTKAVRQSLPPKVRKSRAPVLRDKNTDEVQKNLVRDMTNTNETSIRKSLWGLISSFTGFETAVKNLQNSRRPVKTLQDFLQATKRLVITGTGYNNLFDQITLSTGRAFNALNLHMTRHINKLDGLVVDYSKKSGLPLNDSLARLHVYMMGLHEPERRAVKYLFNVPLENDDTKKNYKLDGVAGTALENVRNTPHELRMAILRELYNAKNNISNDFDANGKSTANKYRAALETLVANHKDNTKGKSGTSMRDVDASTMSLDIANGEYNVIGLYTVDSIKRFKESYEKDPNKKIVDEILKQMKVLGDATTELSKRSHYWSPPVTNISAFYNWDYYVPFKGKGVSYVSEGDDRFELRGKSMGGGMTEFASEFGGRESDSDNPVLQVKVDAIKASMRDGRHGISQALVNLINAKYIKGKLVAKIPFQDRYNGLTADQKEELKGENLFYHYLSDGTVKIYRITDPVMREAIRQAYEAPNPLMGMLGSVTNFMGHTHTRWNPSFHPYNFVRDILTNAFTFGADFGPAKAFQLVESVTSTIFNRGGFSKSAKVSLMYNEGKVKELQKMAETDPFIRDLLEYLEEGGKVSYIMGLSNKAQLEELLTDIDNNGFSKAKNAITKYLDVWGDVFELSSRAATYSALKSTYLAEGLTEKAARQQAAAYAKNLANFEQMGTWGRDLGSLFMFFRPAATGAVRALDAIKTALFSAEQMMEAMPDKLKNDPKAVEEFKKDHAKKRKNAIKMMSVLAAAGAAIFTMAMIAGDDDDAVPPRNKIATDDMSLWTRNIRLPLSILGKDNYLQIPWGFGLGAFAAVGAQIAGAAFGASGLKDIAPNFVTLALDSYVPIPVSRLDPRDNLGMWFLDSVSPSFLRPILEFTVNTDSLGREIYNNRLTKYGDPYIAGKNVPELYRDLAVGMSDLTNGKVLIQPGSIQFWSSNLADGFARMAVTANNAWMLATDQSKFNPKTDSVIFGSFFGMASNYDARMFAELENKMKEHQQVYRMFQRDETQLARWLKDHPNMDVALYAFNHNVNGQLRTLRADYNALLGSRVRNPDGTELTPAERRARVDENVKMQNAVKRDFIAMMEQYKID
jgi:hypothetical protein